MNKLIGGTSHAMSKGVVKAKVISFSGKNGNPQPRHPLPPILSRLAVKSLEWSHLLKIVLFAYQNFFIFLPLFKVFLDKPSISITVAGLQKRVKGSPLHVTQPEGSFTCVPHP